MKVVEKTVRDAWLNFRRASIPKEAHKSQHEAMEMAFYAGGMATFELLVRATADSPDKGDDVSKLYHELREWGRSHGLGETQ